MNIENFAGEALYTVVRKATDKAMVDISEQHLLDKIMDKGCGDDELAAAISTLARLKVLEVSLLLTMYEYDGIPKELLGAIKDRFTEAVIKQGVELGLSSPEAVSFLYPEIKLDDSEKDQVNLARAAKELEESLAEVAKARR